MSVVPVVLEWIEATAISTHIRESIWTYPVIESIHVLGLGLFLGLTMVMDLRLVGVVLRGTPVGDVMGRLLPWIRWGAALMVVTGVLLTIATPVSFAANPFFGAKLVLLALAGVNVWIFHARQYPSVRAWGLAAVPPLAARRAGGISLALWVAIAVAGRLIAYNWFQ